MLKKGDKIALVCCSNGLSVEYADNLKKLITILEAMGLNVIKSKYIFAKNSVFSGNEKERADVLMDFYKDNSIKAIFDISGGDAANGILDFLDYDIIDKNYKPFFGYSDLTTIINALYTKTGKCSYLYQVKNLIGEYSQIQQKDFYNSIFNSENELFSYGYNFIQGDKMEGIVLGGNIRCLLKLSGTEYMPDFNNKILFLESMGGETALIYTYIWHLKQIGAFKNINGILLGTFTTMERNCCKPIVSDILLNILNNKSIPIAVTKDIGHSSNSKCLIIGEKVNFKSKV